VICGSAVKDGHETIPAVDFAMILIALIDVLEHARR
jgi:hypothetical protein